MITERDLEARLRRDATAVRRVARPDAALHDHIMARIVAAPRPEVATRPAVLPRLAPRRLPNQMALAGGLLVVILGLAFAFNQLIQSRLAQQTGGGPALEGAAMAADPLNQNVVVFGGFSDDPGKPSADTWIWYGATWTRRHPTVNPPAREYASMTYDEARGVVVLFGGMGTVSSAGETNLNDTWTWDGSNWTEMHPSTRPPATNGSLLAYDPALQLSVLIDQGQTWTWNGTNWIRVADSPRSKGPIAYDPLIKKVVVLALSDAQTPEAMVDTWAFDGRTWTKLPGGTIPAVGSPIQLAQDPLTGSLVGLDGTRRTWSFDGAKWSLVNTNKPSVAGGAMAYDPVRNVVLQFGGIQNGGSQAHNDLWSWDGRSWTLLAGGNAPQASVSQPPAPATVALSLGASSGTAEWFVLRSTRSRLVETRDGGRSWTLRLQFDGIYDGMSWNRDGKHGVVWTLDMEATGCTTNADGATTCTHAPSSSLTVYSTADGGARWSKHGPTDWPANHVFFRGLEGWALRQGPQTGFGAAPLYHTVDGGATWSIVGTVPEGRADWSAGVGDTPLEFLNGQTGWFATGHVGSPSDSGLLITRDGGRSWSTQSVPAPADIGGDSMVLGHPVFLNDGRALLPASVGQQTDPNTFKIRRRYIYTSVDGGLSWGNPRPLEAPGGVRPTGAQWQNFYLDPSHWWFTATDQQSAGAPVPQASPAVARSTDGGRSWKVSSSPTILQLRFTDAQHGWALAITGPDNRNVLLRTTDGGASWQPVLIRA